MLAHLAACAPEEGCGLLGGINGQVQTVYPVENILHSPVEYLMDATEQVRVMMALEQAELEIAGIFHSHPTGPPTPSPTDVAQAYYPDAVYVIGAPDAEGHWQARGFRIEAGKVVEVELKCTYT